MTGPAAWFVTMLLTVSGAIAARAQEMLSDFALMSPELQKMQQDDFSNPGMLWVMEGEVTWGAAAGEEGIACSECHGAAEEGMTGVAARYPAYDEALGRPVDLQSRINLCRTRHQGAGPLPLESRELLGLAAFIGTQSRGMPVTPDPDEDLERWRAEGRKLFQTRIGQLNLACSQCHEDNAGSRLSAAVIPPAHPTGYPEYRLEWQELGSFQRRLRNCMAGVRAEPLPFGSAEAIALELYLMSRAAGRPVETPAVRP